MSSADWFDWIILPLLIFFSRLADVTLATLRHIFISKGLKKIVPVLGFFEVLIWLVAIRQVFNNLNNIACFLAWAAGFSMGTYVGMLIEEKLALGMQIIRIITNADYAPLVEDLKKNNHGYTLVDAEGSQGAVKLIFLQIRRKNKTEVTGIIHKHLPDAFYSIEDIKNSRMGIFSKATRH
jgi:uncharacterized protein YebE (UPF0316 family)